MIHITLIETIKAAMRDCDGKLAECNKTLQEYNEVMIKLNERKINLEERKKILSSLLDNAIEEQAKLNKMKTKQSGEKTDTAKKSRSKASDEQPAAAAIPGGISINELADKLQVPTTKIAAVSNVLGYDPPMIDNKFTFTSEQADAIRKAILDI